MTRTAAKLRLRTTERVRFCGRGWTAAEKPNSFAAFIPTWFLLGTTLVYASGFLALQLFHDSYGLRGLNTEFLKIRYVHVGILCSAIPVFVGGYAFGLCFWFHSTPKGQRFKALLGKRLSPITLTAALIIILQFWLIAAFAQPGSLAKTHGCLCFTLVVIILALILVRLCPPHREMGLLIIRSIYTVVLLASLVWTVRVAPGFWADLRAMLIPAGFWYIGFSAFFGFAIWIIASPRRQKDAGEMTRIRTLVAMMFLVLLYYLIIASFGYGVLHYIPAGKGGGDFTYAGLIELECVADCQLPDWLFKDNDKHRLVLIETTDASVFVANPQEVSTEGSPLVLSPTLWRQGRQFRPRVAEVSRNCIREITYLNQPFTAVGHDFGLNPKT